MKIAYKLCSVLRYRGKREQRGGGKREARQGEERRGEKSINKRSTVNTCSHALLTFTIVLTYTILKVISD
jgi:hypothetical protein